MPTSVKRASEEIRSDPTRLYGLDADPELIQLESHALTPASLQIGIGDVTRLV
jgi:hypothetical protein